MRGTDTHVVLYVVGSVALVAGLIDGSLYINEVETRWWQPLLLVGIGLVFVAWARLEQPRRPKYRKLRRPREY